MNGLAGALIEPIIEKLGGGKIVDSKDENGFTPLHWAATYRCLPVVELLLKYGASTATVDMEGRGAMNPYTIVVGADITVALKVRSPVDETFDHDATGAKLAKACEKQNCFYYDVEFPLGRCFLSNGL